MDTEEARGAAMDAFVLGMHAASSTHVRQVKLTTVGRLLGLWGLTPYPLTVDKVKVLGAALKAGGYRTAESYLLLYRGEAVRRGELMTPDVAVTIADAKRSCNRGLGGPVRAMSLPFARLALLPEEPDPWNAGGPVGPRNAMVAGSWFLARELELSSAPASTVVMHTLAVAPLSVSWALPASKTDVVARGTVRRHGCACVEAVVTGKCRAHALWDQLKLLKLLFPGRWQGDTPAADLPLFPSADGSVVRKEAMAETIRHAARKLGAPLESPDGSERVSGHSLRVTGAQGLTRAGLELWHVQLLGRWGSDAVRGYVRGAALETSVSWAGRAAAGLAARDLDAVRAELASNLGRLAGLQAQHDAALMASRRFLAAAEVRSAPVEPAALAQEVGGDRAC